MTPKPNLTGKTRYVLKFRFGGSDYPQNFFHYMLGYALPGFYEIDQLSKNTLKSDLHLFIEDWGPIMNEKFSELLNLYQISHSILNSDTPKNSETEVLYAERWDDYLGTKQYFKTASLLLKIKLLVKMALPGKANPAYLLRGRKIIKNIRSTRTGILNLLQQHQETMTESPKPYLFLQRVDESDKYNIQKKFGKGFDYGKVRRSLQGIDAACTKLQGMGYDIEQYTPGNENLLQQIRCFHNAHTVISIRGAELANVFWMKPQSKAIVIDNFGGVGAKTSPATVLADILDVNYCKIKVDTIKHPKIDQELFGTIVKKLKLKHA